jgi:2-polyprenyl-3-methyl-5-hydroxy-6-metoxy-1,4-benzoquinol methylase
MNTGTLSTKEYWDSVLAKQQLPRVNSPKIYNYYVTMNFIDDILKKAKKRTFLEVGCGSSGWLPFFARTYGYVVSGLDYSEIGCRIAEENLKILNISYEAIICQDIFKWTEEKKYDVIFSYGVIEHFEHPEEILKICYDHLDSDGLIITVVPNLQGFMGLLSRLFVRDIYKMHKVITRENILQFHLRCGFKDVKTDYAGVLALGVIPWSKSKLFFFHENTLRRKILLKMITITDKILCFFFKTLRFDFTSSYWSPYVISIMKKGNK